MNSREQNIKNGAIAIAIILAIIIIGIMCAGIYSIISIFTPGFADSSTDKTVLEQYPDHVPTVIIVDNSVGVLNIESGDIFQVSGSNVMKNFSCEFDEGTLTINNTYSQKIHLSQTSKCTLTITVPEGTVLKRLEISAGAGDCIITGISADTFNIEAGAGNIEFNSSSLGDTTLSCGVGNLDIKNSRIAGKSKIECGVGNFTLSNCELLGRCEVNCGVGEFILDLNGSLDDYEIDISSSISEISLNGKTYNKIHELNKGAANSLKIEGGIGSISINID